MRQSINPTPRLTRVYTPQAMAVSQTIVLEKDSALHLIKVLRHTSGDHVVLFNGDGCEYVGEITDIRGQSECHIQLDARFKPSVESPVKVHLIQAIGRGDKMDWVIQKATELGVTEITPVFTERTQVKFDAKKAENRQQRWQAIAVSACEQSGRTALVKVHAPMHLRDWRPQASTLACFLDPCGVQSLASQSLSNALVLVVGPEGGLSEAECAQLQDKGLLGLRLGPRVLRTETAGVAALATIQAVCGDFQ